MKIRLKTIWIRLLIIGWINLLFMGSCGREIIEHISFEHFRYTNKTTQPIVLHVSEDLRRYIYPPLAPMETLVVSVDLWIGAPRNNYEIPLLSADSVDVFYGGRFHTRWYPEIQSDRNLMFYNSYEYTPDGKNHNYDYSFNTSDFE